jgi:hypothetical protein
MSGFLFSSPSTRVNSPPTPDSQLRIQSAVAGRPRAIAWGQTRLAGNLIWYEDFLAIPQYSSAAGGSGGGKGGGGGGSSNGVSSYTYQAAVMIALAEGPIADVLQAWNQSTEQSLSSLNLSVFPGGYSQAPWGYLSSLHPDQADYYRGLSYVAAGPMPLGTSADLPSLNFEIQATIANAYSGIPDANPADIVADYLANANYGAGFPSAYLSNLDTYRSYCQAAGLFASDALVQQRAANDYLKDMLTATNSEFVWSSGLLTIVPYGDSALSDYGATYVPPSAALFALTDDDFMKNSGGSTIGVSAYTSDDPVICVRTRQSDAQNDIKVEYLDRDNDYNPTIVEAQDDSSINLFGLRPSDTNSWHFFCLQSAALMSAQLQLGRQSVRNLYTFTTDQRYIVLDPMDIVAITDESLGLNAQWVRINEITENQDGSLTFSAEEYLAGAASAPAYSAQTNAGYAANYNQDPGDTNAPVIFEPPPQLSGGALQVWMAASGAETALWGGCQLWISTDGASYRLAGSIHGPARQGVLAASLDPGSDPDTANTLAVDLSMSGGILLSTSEADADANHTLCYVDGELISYETATLISASNYALTYLRRGQYGTAVASHSTGASFARLDGQVFEFGYDPSQIGQTIFVKLAAFNVWGGGLQDLSSLSPTSYTIQGPPAPADVMEFAATQNGAVVSFSWMRNTNDFALKGYDIGYAPQGTTDWSLFTMLTEAAAGTEMTNAEVPPGTWTFGCRGRDIADQLSPDIAQFDLIVTNQNATISSVPQEPDWTGTTANLFRHYTGVLVPLGQYSCSHYSDWSVFDIFVPDVVSSASYAAPVVDTGYNDTLRVYDTSAATPGPGQSGPVAGLAFAIDAWLSGETDPALFIAWTLGYVEMRYLVAQLTYNPVPGSVGFITDFTATIDTAPTVETVGSVVISAGGTAITFPTQFHLPPDIQVTVQGTSPRYGTAANVTASGATLHVWDDSHPAVDVGGTVTYTATGE